MKKIFRKSIVLILAVMMIFALCMQSALAEDIVTGNESSEEISQQVSKEAPEEIMAGDEDTQSVTELSSEDANSEEEQEISSVEPEESENSSIDIQEESADISEVSESESATESESDSASKPESETEKKNEGESSTESETESDPEMTLFETVTGSFDLISGYEIATIRYYSDSAKTDYYFAEFEYDDNTEKYTYSFDAPYTGFAAVQGTEMRGQAPDDNATVIAYYYSLTKWDGAVDVSWYDAEAVDIYVTDPAQLAGVAAIVNGSVDATIPKYSVRGSRTDNTSKLPSCIENEYDPSALLPAGVKDEAYRGLAKYDFSDKTIHIMSDLDMGGTDGSGIYMEDSANGSGEHWLKNLYDYPNWTPIGGEYLMDVSDGSTLIIASFNGSIEGHGHNIRNLYCFRWSYRDVGDTAYAYCQGVGLVGMMGSLYSGESAPNIMPSIRNLGLYGYIYGRRMVGGFVGCLGGGSSAASGTSVTGGVTFENLVNHAYVYATDSKGAAGIVATAMATGSIVNCYNRGYICNVYAAPTGGIVGSNEGMDVFCCYNTGTINTNGNSRGRGIGCDNSGSNYTVDNCYYLEGCGDDTRYPGYYTYNLAPSVSINVTEMTAAQMMSSELLNGLNMNGVSYVTGPDGYPILMWEAEQTGTGNVTIAKPEGGTVLASATGSLANGTIVYLANNAEIGWNFRNYTLNGEAVSGDYITVNGDCVISAYFESAKAGVLKIEQNSICNISVTKNGTIFTDGVAETVEDYPVKSGDEIYEGDLLIVEASIKDGQVPADKDLEYSASVGLAAGFDYGYTYTGGEETITQVKTFTVDSSINGDEVSLTLSVKPRTTQKLWRYLADTSWYSDSETEFVFTSPEQFAGLAILVEQGNNFEGKTIRLGGDVSFVNTDGTTGNRFWDGLGITGKTFAGTFDGQNYKITDFHSNKGSLFTYAYGTSASSPAVIKNVNIYGAAEGKDVCGIVSFASNAEISNCNSYVALNGTSGYIAGILGSAASGTVNVTNCYNYGNISGTGAVGGIAGSLNTTSSVIDCINRGDISVLSTNGNNVGGVVGSLNGTILRCANYGNIEAYGRTIGGIAGQSVSAKASITDAYNVGNVSYSNGSNSYDCIGGVVGFGSYYVITNSYNYGIVSENGLISNYIGGLIGREGAKSSSSTSEVYMLDTSSEYVDAKTVFADLPETDYTSGMKLATDSEFSDSTGVYAAINGNNSFVLNGLYPEFSAVSLMHVHSGGTATCTARAVCDECGLEYGEIDPENHVDTVVRNAEIAVWIYDGYTGDKYCRDCGLLLETGNVIKADTEREAITINIANNGSVINTKTYTVSQFDALKSSDTPIGYSYGTKSTEIMAATEYVTFDTIFSEFGLTVDDIESVIVRCDSSVDTVSAEILKTCNLYYEDGVAYDAPAAICISWGTLSGSLDVVAKACTPNDKLRFGYGISEQQYNDGTSMGGARLVSPVRTVTINIAGTALSGTINGYSGEGSVSVELYAEGSMDPFASVNGTSEYSFSSIPSGSYTMIVSAEGGYVQREYDITIGSGETIQDIQINLLGDVNQDGRISAADITRLARHVAKIIVIEDDYNLKLCDTNKDGSVKAADITRLARYVAKIIDEF